MKISTYSGSLELILADQDEMFPLITEAEALGLTVKENKRKHLEVFGDDSKLYRLITILSCTMILEIH